MCSIRFCLFLNIMYDDRKSRHKRRSIRYACVDGGGRIVVIICPVVNALYSDILTDEQ